MLNAAAIKVSLEEPQEKLLAMANFMKGLGTRRIKLLHVHAEMKDRERAQVEATLGSMAAALEADGLEVEVHLRQGQPALEVSRAVRELEVDYLSLYWMPKGTLHNLLLGSIDSDILRMTDLPVFVYDRGWFNDDLQSVQSALYATDFQLTDQRVLPYLRSHHFQAQTLYLLHAGERAPDPQTERLRQEQVEENLQRLADACRESYEEVHLLQVVGHPQKEIVRQAKRLKVDLILIGKSDKPNPMAQLMGSNAEVIPRQARCSVFIIPGAYQTS